MASPNLLKSLVGFSALQHQSLLNTFAQIGGVDTITTLNLGSSGVAGTLNIFPATAASGQLTLVAANNAGNTTTTITNASFGQTTALTIPDPGNATANFILSKGTPVFATNVTISGGNSLLALPVTGSNGYLQIKATNDTGNFAKIITTSGNFGQATTFNLVDPLTASANIILSQGAQSFTGIQTFNTNLKFGAGATLSGDVGTGTEAGNAVTISNMAGVITTSSLTTAGAGNYVITLTNTKIASTDVVLLTLAGGSNNATFNISTKCVSGAGSAVITIYNNTAATSLNGTLIFNFLVVKSV